MVGGWLGRVFLVWMVRVVMGGLGLLVSGCWGLGGMDGEGGRGDDGWWGLCVCSVSGSLSE